MRFGMESSSPTSPSLHRGGRPRRGEDRIEKLLDVAEECFLAEGYVETSIDGLARRAAISKKTIYSRFENKAELFRAVVHRVGIRTLGAELPDEDDLPLRDGLRMRLRRLAMATTDPAVLAINRLAASQGRKFPEIAQTLKVSGFERYHLPISRYLASCVRRGLIKQIDCEFTTDVILGAMSSPLTYSVIFDTPVGVSLAPVERADKLCDLIVDGLIAP